MKQTRVGKLKLTRRNREISDDKGNNFNSYKNTNEKRVHVDNETELNTSTPSPTFGVDLTILSNSADGIALRNKLVK